MRAEKGRSLAGLGLVALGAALFWIGGCSDAGYYPGCGFSNCNGGGPGNGWGVRVNGFDGAVRALDVDATGSAYLIGDFTQWQGSYTPGIAKLDGNYGLQTSFNPGVANNELPVRFNAIKVVGTSVWVGGDFQMCGVYPSSHACPYLATFQTDGTLIVNSDPGLDGPVNHIAASGTTVFAAGDFQNYSNGTAYSVNGLAEWSSGTFVSSFSFNGGGIPSGSFLSALAADGSNLYFSRRNSADGFQLFTAGWSSLMMTPSSSGPNFGSGIPSLVAYPGGFAAGGGASGSGQPFLETFSASSFTPTQTGIWAAGTTGQITALTTDGTTLYYFMTGGAQGGSVFGTAPVSFPAELTVSPAFNGPVWAVAYASTSSGPRLYVGGEFAQYQGVTVPQNFAILTTAGALVTGY